MSFDIPRFYTMFFDEAQEHLKNMEVLLLGLDITHPDEEQLNAIFRAIHSIKGSGGTLGFNYLVEITHVLENLLDRIRKGELTLTTTGIIDAFLDAIDVMRMLLAHHRDNGIADFSKVEEICTRLRQLTNNIPAPQSSDIVADGHLPRVSATTSLPVSPAAGIWEVSFNLDQNIADAVVTVKNIMTAMKQNCPAELLACMSDQSNTNTSVCRISLGSNVDIDWVRGLIEFVARSDSVQFQYINSGKNKVTDKLSMPEFDGVTDATAAHRPDYPNGKDQRRSSRADNRNGDTSIRVDVGKVDQLINLVGELVITQSMLVQSAQGVDAILFERLLGGLGQLERNTRDLQESVMSIRMMPMSVVFSRFPRVIHDLSQKLGKKVELKTMGESTELDKGLIERITDPLTHLVRNSLDHGIEMPADRLAKGKQPAGTIILKAYQQSGNVVIEVSDDGAGLNRTKILAKARERGMTVHDQMTDTEVWMLIFEAGFSTADQISEISGRGVGMDVVKRNITDMGGRIAIHSETGIGTRVTVRLPLTLAILDGMSIAAGQETYIIPLGCVIESLQASRDMIKSMSGIERMIQLRGEYLPVIALYELFNIPNALTRLSEGIMVIIESDGCKAALFVDALIGQHQVVIKSLETNYRKVAGIGGATIMGDGHVALILDVASLVRMAHGAASDIRHIVQAA